MAGALNSILLILSSGSIGTKVAVISISCLSNWPIRPCQVPRKSKGNERMSDFCQEV